MDELDVSELHPGDEVKWIDPDDGLCSKVIVIRKIKFVGDVVCIWYDNGYLECFAEELV